MKRPLFTGSLGYFLGFALLPSYFLINQILATAIALIAVGVVFIFLLSNKFISFTKNLGIFLMGIGFSLIICSLFLQNHLIPLATLGGRTITVEGSVTNITYTSHQTIEAKVNLIDTQFKDSYYIEFADYSGDNLKIGESFTGDINLDLLTYNKLADNISGGVWLKGDLVPSSLNIISDPVFPITVLTSNIRQYISSNINSALSSPYDGLAIALTTGDRSYMDSDLRNSMTTAGTSHLTAVSGMHMSIITMTCLSLLRLLGMGKTKSALLTMIVPIIFGCICGFSPSVSRAIIMIVLTLLAEIIFRTTDLPTSVAVALIISLTLNPLWAKDVGFILSYSSTLGMGLISPIIKKAFPLKTKNKPLLIVYSSTVSSLSAWIALLPITPLYFGYLSLLSPIINSLLGITASVALILSLLCGILPTIPVFTGILSFITTLSLMPMVKLSTFAASLEYANLPINTPTKVISLLLCALLIYITLILGGRKLSLSLLPLGCGMIIFTSSICHYYTSQNGYFITLGQGYMTLTIDGGSSIVFTDYDGYYSFLAEDSLIYRLDNIIALDDEIFTKGDISNLLKSNPPSNFIHSSGVYGQQYLSRFTAVSAHDITANQLDLGGGIQVEFSENWIKFKNPDILLLKNQGNYDIIDNKQIVISHDNSLQLTEGLRASHYDFNGASYYYIYN